MKRFIYSNYTKFAAFILCALSVAVSAYFVTTAFFKEDNAYFFESSYEDSHFAGNALSEQFSLLSMHLENTMDEKGKLHPEQIKAMPSPDEWECYIKTDGGTYTNLKNQNDENYDKFRSSELSIGVRVQEDKNNKGLTRQGFKNGQGYGGYYFISNYDGDDLKYEMCVRMGEKYKEEHRVEWENIKESGDSAAKKVITLLIFSIAVFIYLLCVTGRKYGSDEIQMLLVDKMFVEITAALFLGIFFGLGALTIFGAGYFIIGEGVMIANEVTALAVFCVVSLSLLLFLSLVRNLRNGTFFKRSMVVRICKFMWKCFKKICKFLWDIRGRIWSGIKNGIYNTKHIILSVSAKNFSGRFVGTLLVAFALGVCILTVLTLVSPVCIVFLAVFVIGVIIFVAKRLVGFENLKNGIDKIKNGDLNHKITDCPDGVIGQMADNINTIGEGLQKSLEREVKAERMKSMLITNVSHDLKTPLTTIINYADLLSKEKLSPDEANDYVKIIQQKGERLKQLTSDLFDISKVQSGSEDFDIEDIDICLLVNQALAEFNEDIEKSGLDFRVAVCDKEVFVKGDGKKLSRVFENLFINCVKYAMKNTRVYIDIKSDDTGAAVEIKNIAGYEMNFDVSEISERFVRGDESRTSEGSGLGLAIVKSYVEGCGGTLEIITDGDLFKVTVRFIK
jgi:signal transduction histidine kinase